MRRYVVLAPTGEPLKWTKAASPAIAQSRVTRDWEFALTQGYRVALWVGSGPWPVSMGPFVVRR